MCNKKINLLASLVFASLTLFVCSCGDGSSKESDVDDIKTTDNSSSEEPVEVYEICQTGVYDNQSNCLSMSDIDSKCKAVLPLYIQIPNSQNSTELRRINMFESSDSDVDPEELLHDSEGQEDSLWNLCTYINEEVDPGRYNKYMNPFNANKSRFNNNYPYGMNQQNPRFNRTNTTSNMTNPWYNQQNQKNNSIYNNPTSSSMNQNPGYQRNNGVNGINGSRFSSQNGNHPFLQKLSQAGEFLKNLKSNRR